MASGDLALRLLISASAGSAISEIAKLATSAIGLKTPMAEAAVVGVAAVAGIGAASVKMAGNFQSSMTKLVTSAGEFQSNLKTVGDGILKISVDTGTSTQQLADGMYYVESAGNHGADALTVLTAAAQGAKSENADLITVTKALTTVMTDYHMPVSDSTKAMDGLISTVQHGKTSLQDLSGSMGAVLPIASSLHIPFQQVAGALDTMTNAGMPAQQAAQNLAHVLTALSAPSAVAVKSMKEVGLSADGVKNALVNQGLPEALQQIEDAVGKKFPEGSVAYETALKNILGGLVGFKLAAQLTGDSLNETQQNINAISSAMNSSGKEVMGFADIQKTLNFQLDRTKAAFDALMIALGTRLLPIVTPIVKTFADLVQALTAVISVGQNVSSAMQSTGDSIGKVGPIAQNIAGMMRVMASSWSDLAASSQPVINAFKNFAQTVGQIMAGAVSQMLRVVDDINRILVALAQAAGTIAVPALALLAQWFKNAQSAAEIILNAIDGSLIPAFESLIGTIGPIIANIINFVKESNAIPIVFAVVSTVVANLIKILSGLIQGIADVLSVFKNAQVTTVALTLALGGLGGYVAKLAVEQIPQLVASVATGLKTAFTSAMASILGTAAATTAEADASEAAAKSATELTTALRAVAISSAAMAAASGADAETVAAAAAAYDAPPTAATADAVATSAAVGPTVALGAAIWAATGPFVLIGLAIAAVVAGLILLYKNSAPFREFVDGLVDGAKQLWNWFVNQIKPALEQLGQTLKTAFIPVWNELADAWKHDLLPALKQLWDALQPLMPILQTLGEGVLAILLIAIVAVTAALVALTKVIAGIAEGLADILGGAIKVVIGLFQELDGVLSFLYDLITGNWNHLGDDLGKIWDGVKTQLGGGAQMLQGVFEGMFDSLKGLFDGLGDVIGPSLQQAGEQLGPWWAQFWSDDIAKPAQQAWSDIAAVPPQDVKIIGDAFSGLGTHMHDFWQDDISKPAGQAFSDLGTLAQNGLKTVQFSFQSAFQEIGNFFGYINQHDYYAADFAKAWQMTGHSLQSFWADDISKPAQQAMDDIGKFSMDAAKNMKSAFDSIPSHLQSFWTDDFSKPAQQAMTDIGNFAMNTAKSMQTTFDDMGKHLAGFWQDDIVKPGGQAFSDLGKAAHDAMDAIGQGFGNLWGVISQNLSQLGGQIAGWFNDLAMDAAKWGANLMTQFIQGIGSMFSALGSKVNDIAKSIENLIGWHSPTKEGPGSNSDQWMPNLISMLVRGLNAGVPQVQNASQRLAGGIAGAFAMNSNSFALSPSGSLAANGQPNAFNLTINMDGRQITQAVGVQIAREVRIQAGVRSV